MTDAELDKKLVGFNGLKNELGADINSKIGKLMVDEAEEQVNADSETFIKLFNMMGGVRVCIVLAATYILTKS